MKNFLLFVCCCSFLSVFLPGCIGNDYVDDLVVPDSQCDSVVAAETDIFQVVEKMPHYPACEEEENSELLRQCANREMLTFIYDNLVYPQAAKDNAIEGTVVIRFIVQKDGCLSNFTLLRGLGYGCDEEAMRVVGLLPDFVPGTQRETPVHVYFNLPIKFRL